MEAAELGFWMAQTLPLEEAQLRQVLMQALGPVRADGLSLP
jgi:hypothetical protein